LPIDGFVDALSLGMSTVMSGVETT